MIRLGTLASIAAAGLLIATPAAAQGDLAEIHTFHCLYSCPAGAPATNDLVVREIYTLSNNDDTKFADWVAYVVRPDLIAKSPPRVWKADPWLNAQETLEPPDYDGASTALSIDRGHQAPLATLAGAATWPDANLLSNITPQRKALNEGSWEHLEAAERTLSLSAKLKLFVLTGPVYERKMAPLPKADEPHAVPSGYWKIVTTEADEQSVFFFDQDAGLDVDYCGHRTTLADIEARTHLVFFPRLHDRAFKSLDARLGCK